MGFLGKNSIIAPNSKYHKSPNGGFYYNNELWFSKAYQKLNESSVRLLHCFLTERRWHRKTKEVTNNGSISFTEVQFREICGYTKATYIIQTYRGGMCRGDMAKYKLLFIKGVPLGEQRWREYPGENWVSEIPKTKNNQVGIKTRFKKGETGRKTKATLLKDTHNNANDPIKVYPKK